MTIKKIIIATFILAITPLQMAASQGSDFSISGDITGISDYRFRGVSLTSKNPAVQGTLTVEHSSGFYVSAWGTNISEFNGANTEFDFMAGYVFSLDNDVSIDIGVMEYTYPGGTGTNYFEIYGSASMPVGIGEFSVGVNYTLSQTNIGGTDDIYIFTSYSMPLLDTGLNVNTYIAYEDGAFGNEKLDWALGLSYDIEKFTVGVDYIDTNLGAGNGAATAVGYVTFSF